MSLDTSSNATTLDPANYPDSPSIKLQFHGFILDLGEASDRLLDCFIEELTNKLGEMIERNNKQLWASGSKSYEYNKSQVHYHLRGLMKERSRRLDLVLRSQPAAVVVGVA